MAMSFQTGEGFSTSTIPLTWHEKVEGTQETGKEASVVLGHCTFISLLVEELIPGYLYA
jgi:hypothetical protein